MLAIISSTSRPLAATRTTFGERGSKRGKGDGIKILLQRWWLSDQRGKPQTYFLENQNCKESGVLKVSVNGRSNSPSGLA
jgi:hypothetical protein